MRLSINVYCARPQNAFFGRSCFSWGASLKSKSIVILHSRLKGCTTRKRAKQKSRFVAVRSILLCMLSVLISSCSGDNSDLVKYINDIKSRPGLPIEPIPQFAPLPSFIFPEQDTRRSPFKAVDLKKIAEQYAPDQKRIKEPLEAFPLDALRFVGTLRQGSELWALIRDPQKQVLPVKVGNYMGQDYGRILSIKNDEITLEETIKNSGAWEKRKTTLHLDTGKEGA